MTNKLEILLRACGRKLAEEQIAYFWKVPEEMVATPCDFFGFTRTGRAILIEAKMVNRTSLPIGKSPGLLPHQWNALRDADRAKCHAFLVWGRKGEALIMNATNIARITTMRKSIPWNAPGSTVCPYEKMMPLMQYLLQ